MDNFGRLPERLVRTPENMGKRSFPAPEPLPKGAKRNGLPMLKRSMQYSRLFWGGFIPGLVFLLAMGSSAPAQEIFYVEKDDGSYDLTHRSPHLDWREAKYVVSGTMMNIKDQNSESGLGIRVQGPDPFRKVKDRPSRYTPGWRVGLNQFDFNDPNTGTPTELSVVTVGLGAEYYFRKLEANTPFASLYLNNYYQRRSGGNPNTRDESYLGVNLGIGYESKRLRTSVEKVFLDGSSGQDAYVFELGYRF